MRIVVFDNRLTPQAQQQIQALATEPITFPQERYLSENELINRTGDAEIVLVSPWDKVTKSYLAACPNLKYVCLCGTSTANIALDELQKRGIVFTNVVSHGKESVAEFVFMQLVRLARGEGDYQWKPEQRQLMGKTIGIIGLGSVGQGIAHLALAYKMNVVYAGPHRKPEWEARGLQYKKVSDLLGASDIVVLAAPTNVQVLGKKEFKSFKSGSIIVQASSGTPFDKPAFFEWIAQDGNFAIFDKSAGEENYHEYKDIPRIIFSEKVGGDTYETDERRANIVVENIRAYLAKAVLIGAV
jgi:phosphoglycerate dehydrogenase-like enzyme